MDENSHESHNILSLSQRVLLIHEYDVQTRKPKIRTLAKKYNVSLLEIESILLNSESILKDDFLRKRQEKIELLGKIMYEYIQRVMQLNLSVDDETVLQKAAEVNECIAIVNFRPTLKWLNDFKKAYGIPSFDLLTLRRHITLTESKRHQLTVIDLIAHASRGEKKPDNDNLGCGNVARTRLSSPPPLFYNNKEPKIVNERISDDDIEVKPTTINVARNPQSSPPDTRQQSTTHKRQCTDYSMCEIDSLEEALKHLRLLEEYAMLQDNFRAIGLLTQLEEVFKKPLK